MAMYRIRVLDIDTHLIRFDIHIGKVSIKSLFLNKIIIFDTRLIRPDTCIGKMSVKSLFLNKKIIIYDTICVS
jgi:hypothetical protein